MWVLAISQYSWGIKMSLLDKLIQLEEGGKGRK